MSWQIIAKHTVEVLLHVAAWWLSNQHQANVAQSADTTPKQSQPPPTAPK